MKKIFMSLLLVGFMVGCGSSDDSTDDGADTGSGTVVIGKSYKLPSTLELLYNEVPSLSPKRAALFTDSSTDYSKEQTKIEDSEISVNFGLVNIVLSLLRDTSYSDFIDKGQYVALSTVESEIAVGTKIISEVTQETDYLNIKMWIPTQGLYVNYDIREGITETLPLGDFTMTFVLSPNNYREASLTVGSLDDKPFLKFTRYDQGDDKNTGLIAVYTDNNLSSVATYETEWDSQNSNMIDKKMVIQNNIATRSVEGVVSYYDMTQITEVVDGYSVFDVNGTTVQNPPATFYYAHTTEQDRNNDSSKNANYALNYISTDNLLYITDGFSVKDGTIVYDAPVVTANQYRVKAKKMTLQPKLLASKPTNALDIDTTLVLPSSSIYDSNKISFYLNTTPDVTQLTTKVIDGIVQ